MKFIKFFKKLSLYFIILLFIFGTILIFLDTKKNSFSKYIKDNTPYELKYFLSNTIFYVPKHLREFYQIKNELKALNHDLYYLNLKNDLNENLLSQGKNETRIILSKNNQHYTLSKYTIPFSDQKNLLKNKKTGYLETTNDSILVVFTSGKIIRIDKNKLIDGIFFFKEIYNNLDDFLITPEVRWTGIRGIKINNNDIYLSFTNLVKNKENCYNISILKSVFKEEGMNFNKLIDDNECIESSGKENINPGFKNFNGYQTGGRIIFLEKDIIVYSVGDFNDWRKPQDLKSSFGKILEYNITENKKSIRSLGHRNSQGLYFDRERKLIISTDHGAKGGDEVNLISANESAVNFGWPISSYGDHYEVVPLSQKTKRIAPLYKSHIQYGFREPILVFSPSIGISQIIKNNFNKKNNYFVTSLKNKTIYEIELNSNFDKANIVDEISVGERIRDLVYDKELNVYYLYLEDSPAVGILSHK
jgi:hypothetical protein